MNPCFLAANVNRAFTDSGLRNRKVLVGIDMVGQFVGRDSDIERVNELLKGPNQYITIHGFGGLGKTALALHVAKRFDDGKVLALPLVGTPRLSDVIRKIARFLYVDLEGLSNLEEQKWEVIEKLRNEGTILMYLDNV